MTGMQHWLVRFHAFTHSWHHFGIEAMLAFVVAVLVIVVPAEASTRFQERSLFVQSAVPSATTSYTVSLRYMTALPVGSLDLLFCVDPIPHHACVPPPGLDVSGAVLASQSGEGGFGISVQTPNHITLSRTPGMIVPGDLSSYKFDNIVNPNSTVESFSIRLRSHSSVDASGPQIDFGSVKSQMTDSITIETQVPPMLMFCLAEQVNDNCEGTNDTYFNDMGTLGVDSTLTATSQMAVGTNATGGFVITANGNPMSAGTNVIDGIEVPAASIQGKNQFGINLVANTAPAIGSDPEGAWTNAVPSPEYSVPDRYKYVPGDVVAFSPNVSLMKKFTVSYIVNSSESLKPGFYATTINFIASGQF